MKTLLTILFIPVLSFAVGDYEGYSCYQKCGLTPQTPDQVYARALDSYTVKSMLGDACKWRSMNLQGEPYCTTYKYDPTKSENGARCIKGINTNNNCMASVDGRGDIDRGSYRTFQKFANNFDDAIDIAMDACKEFYRGKNTYDYRCDVAGYYAY